jgi:hypothetical protein
MKSKEIFLCVVAFIVLLSVFGIVAITADYTEKSVQKPDQDQTNSIEKNQTNRTSIHNSADAPETAVYQSKPKRTPLVASNRLTNNRLGSQKMNSWSSNARRIHSEVKERLTPVECNGRIYLENTSGIEASDEDNNNNDETAIEVVE